MPWKWLSKPKYKNQGAVVPRRPLSAQEQPAVGWEAEGQKTTQSGHRWISHFRIDLIKVIDSFRALRVSRQRKNPDPENRVIAPR
jgi:hypothetical protein